MDIPEQIANLITENLDEVRSLDTPSQVFSQALLQSDNSHLSLEDAIERIKEYGAVAGLDPLMVRDAVEYAKLKWGFYGAADDSARYRDISDVELGPDLPDVDSFSDRGY